MSSLQYELDPLWEKSYRIISDDESNAFRRLSSFDKRIYLSIKQEWKCFWCEQIMICESGYQHSATKEHLIPKSKGGSSGLSNLCSACYRCNNLRKDLDQYEFTILSENFLPDTRKQKGYEYIIENYRLIKDNKQTVFEFNTFDIGVDRKSQLYRNGNLYRKGVLDTEMLLQNKIKIKCNSTLFFYVLLALAIKIFNIKIEQGISLAKSKSTMTTKQKIISNSIKHHNQANMENTNELSIM